MAKSKAKSKQRTTKGRKLPVKNTVRKTARKKKPSKTPKPKVASKKARKTSTTKAKHKPQKKSAWKLSPQEQNSMQEVHVWRKGNSTFQFSEEILHGHAIIVGKPDLSKYDPDVGVKIYEAFGVLEYVFSESSSGNPEFSDDISEDERDRLWNLWREKGESGLMDEGWSLKVDIWFYGPLLVEEAE
jgi:hypothetical protein